MALRLGTYVLEGELWNTKRHSTGGWLNLRGGNHILQLDLTGNPAPDLQGCKIRFEPGEVSKQHFSNLEEGDGAIRPEIDLSGIALHQIGVPGQITAACWCRVLSSSVSELMDKKKEEREFLHSADCHRLLYLEWYSQNGRVVIELPAPEIVFLEGDDSWDPEQNPPPEFRAESEERNGPGPNVISVRNEPGEPPEVQAHSMEKDHHQETDSERPDLFPDDLNEYIDRLVGDLDRERFLNDPEDITGELGLMDHLIEEGEGKPFCVLLEVPDKLPSPEQLGEEGACRLVSAMLMELALHGVALHMCPHYSFLDTYRLMIDEFLTDQFYYSELQGTGWTTNFMTAEFCETCKQEAEEKYEEWEEDMDLDEDPEPPEEEVKNLLSKVRKHLKALQEQLRAMNRETGAPTEPLSGISTTIPGLNRILVLVPVILERLDEDLLARNIRPDVPEVKEYVLDGLHLIDGCIRGIREYARTNLLDDSLRLFSEALELGDRVALIPKHVNFGRFFDDIKRLLPDIDVVHQTWKHMKRNRLRQPEVPEGENVQRPGAWYEYFEQKMMMEEPIVRILAVEGFTPDSLIKGCKLQQKQHEERNQEIKREREIRESDIVRSAVFDPERPEQFLDMKALPEKGDLDVDDSKGFDEPSSGLGYLESLPGVKEWEEVKEKFVPGSYEKSSSGGVEVEKPLSPEDDPIKEWFIQFCGDFSDRVHELVGEEENLLKDRPELVYLEILSMKPGPRIAGSYTWVNSENRFAPVFGAYLHAISCLRRIKRGIDQFEIEGLMSFLDRIREGIGNINQQLR